MQLPLFERDADALLTAVTRARYLEASGRWPSLSVVPIYERFPDVASLDTYEQLLDLQAEERVAQGFQRLVLEQYVAASVAAIDEEMVTTERLAAVDWLADAVPMRAARQLVGLEPDRTPRHDLDEQIRASRKPLARLRIERRRAARTVIDRLGQYDVPNDDLGFWAHVRNVNLDEVSKLATYLLDATEQLWFDALRDQLIHHRLADGDAWEVDLDWILRGAEYDRVYPAQRLVPAVARTLLDLGIRLQDQTEIRLDLEDLPARVATSFCAPIGVPDEIVVALAPKGGVADFVALMRGLGEAERHAHADRTQPLPYRRLGDGAVVEGYGLLFGALVGNVGWLELRLEAEATRDAVRLSAFERLYRLRRAAAEHLYEVELRAAEEPEALADEYVDRLAEALLVRPFPERALDILDDPFRSARHLRAALFGCQLGGFLAREFDEDWYRSARAGRFLADRWREGQRYTAEEIAQFLGDEGLDPSPTIAELRAGLTD